VVSASTRNGLWSASPASGKVAGLAGAVWLQRDQGHVQVSLIGCEREMAQEFVINETRLSNGLSKRSRRIPEGPYSTHHDPAARVHRHSPVSAAILVPLLKIKGQPRRRLLVTSEHHRPLLSRKAA
jgi:hypothetical protein